MVDDQETREPTRMLQAETVGESQADADASAPRIPSAVAPLLVQITLHTVSSHNDLITPLDCPGKKPRRYTSVNNTSIASLMRPSFGRLIPHYSDIGVAAIGLLQAWDHLPRHLGRATRAWLSGLDSDEKHLSKILFPRSTISTILQSLYLLSVWQNAVQSVMGHGPEALWPSRFRPPQTRTK